MRIALVFFVVDLNEFHSFRHKIDFYDIRNHLEVGCWIYKITKQQLGFVYLYKSHTLCIYLRIMSFWWRNQTSLFHYQMMLVYKKNKTINTDRQTKHLFTLTLMHSIERSE